MKTEENIISYYRDKIEQRYIICAVFLGLCCVFLFDEPFTSNYHWIIRGMQKSLMFISGGLAISLLLRYQSLKVLLDARYADSLQRFEDFILKHEKSEPSLKQRLLSMLIVYAVILTLSIFFLKDKVTIGMMLGFLVLFTLAMLFQKLMGNEDRKILKELKEKLSPNQA